MQLCMSDKEIQSGRCFFFFRRHVNYVEVVWVEMGFQFAVTCETKLQEENGLFLYRCRGHVGQTIDRELL